MTKAETLFHKIVEEVPGAKKGKMFGALCIKAANGKAVAILWKDNMLFRLDRKTELGALKLNGAHPASHLYAPEKPMNGWIELPYKHSDRWTMFTAKAIAFVETLKK